VQRPSELGTGGSEGNMSRRLRERTRTANSSRERTRKFEMNLKIDKRRRIEAKGQREEGFGGWGRRAHAGHKQVFIFRGVGDVTGGDVD
jgi:hypothetical protein